ncbi:MAG: hypothetical protein JHD02_06600 [Thermoleophilaceae bacterium]|nr:hypothetical protein [Thermoleophilaceae bacterium]
MLPGDATTNAMVVQPDGKIVLAGAYSKSDNEPDVLAVARLDADGSPDLDFGKEGVFVLDIAEDTRATSLTIEAHGKIVVVGSAYDTATKMTKLLILRLTGNGRLDPSFNRTGVLTTDLASRGGAADSVAPVRGDKLLVIGRRGPVVPSIPVAVRVLYDGTLDPAYADEGVFDIPLSTSAEPRNWTGEFSQSVRAVDGSVLLAGRRSSYPAIRSQSVFARFDSTGNLDPIFGYNGRVAITNNGDNESPDDLALQPDGKIVLVGASYVGIASERDHPFFQRLNNDGSPDQTFGVASRLPIAVAGQSGLHALAIDPNGRAVAGGEFRTAGKSPNRLGSLLARANSNGTPDEIFGVKGGVATASYGRDVSISDIAVTWDNRILAAGRFSDGLSVARFRGTEIKPLSSAIRTPSRYRLKAHSLRSFSGTASGSDLESVQIAVLKRGTSLLHGRHLCRHLSDKSAKFVMRRANKKANKRRCVPTKWLRATGTRSWRYAMKRDLPSGSYEIYVRAVDAGDWPQTSPTRKRFKLVH